MGYALHRLRFLAKIGSIRVGTLPASRVHRYGNRCACWSPRTFPPIPSATLSPGTPPGPPLTILITLMVRQLRHLSSTWGTLMVRQGAPSPALAVAKGVICFGARSRIHLLNFNGGPRPPSGIAIFLSLRSALSTETSKMERGLHVAAQTLGWSPPTSKVDTLV